MAESYSLSIVIAVPNAIGLRTVKQFHEHSAKSDGSKR